MAYTSAPLPGVTQLATVTDWETFFSSISASWVVAGALNQLNPTLDASGRNAVIDTGNALIRGFSFQNTSSTSTPVPAASSQNRIDRLVLRLNRSASTAATFIVPTVITGTPAAQPAEPALTRTTTGLWDLPISRWTSASSGALTGLASERQFGAPVMSGLSGARPVMPGPGLLLETDTGNLAWWSGSAWSYIATAPDSWHTITSFAAGGWAGTLSYTKVTPRLACLTVNLTLTATAAVADDTLLCTLAAGYRPQTAQEVVLRVDAMELGTGAAASTYSATSAVKINTDGTVAIVGVGRPSTFMRGAGSYPLDI